MKKDKNMIFGQTGVGMSFSNKRNILMECFDPNSKKLIITDPKTDKEFLKEFLKEHGYQIVDTQGPSSKVKE